MNLLTIINIDKYRKDEEILQYVPHTLDWIAMIVFFVVYFLSCIFCCCKKVIFKVRIAVSHFVFYCPPRIVMNTK